MNGMSDPDGEQSQEGGAFATKVSVVTGLLIALVGVLEAIGQLTSEGSMIARLFGWDKPVVVPPNPDPDPDPDPAPGPEPDPDPDPLPAPEAKPDPVPLTFTRSATLTTGPIHARVMRDDCEVHSDDNTRVDLRYDLRIASDKRRVEARLIWSVYEFNKSKTKYRTKITSTLDWTTVFAAPSQVDRLDKILVATNASRSQWYSGKAHGWKAFPTTEALSDVQVRFDGNGSDCERQGLSSRLNLSVRGMPRQSQPEA